VVPGKECRYIELVLYFDSGIRFGVRFLISGLLVGMKSLALILLGSEN
jgi:hypothetical protein